MKTLLFATLLLVNLNCALADDSPNVQVQKTEELNVSLNSKGLDVRFVLHDLFSQSKKNYVLNDVPYRSLYLNLNGIAFEKGLKIICELSNLTYTFKNDIYTIKKNSGSRPTPTPSTSEEVAPKTESTPTHTTAKPVTPAGRLELTVLKKPVTGAYYKTDFAEILSSLGTQTGIKLEVATNVPKYKLDFVLGKTSLGWALNALAEKLALKVVFTEDHSIRLEPKK